jgi:enamine deaminase RidA (YjgF/YER057c/UK114 family)
VPCDSTKPCALRPRSRLPPDFISPPPLYAGAPYEYAALAPAGGRLVFAAGACPLNDAGEVVAPGDYEAQAHAALENLRVSLEAAGSGFEQVLKTTVYVASADRVQLVRVWKAVEETFAPAKPPSTLLGVATLGYSGQLVEIEAVGLAPES